MNYDWGCSSKMCMISCLANLNMKIATSTSVNHNNDNSWLCLQIFSHLWWNITRAALIQIPASFASPQHFTKPLQRRRRRKIYKTCKASWWLFEIIHSDQESQGTDNRDLTWHSSFSQFLTFMILKCPILWTSNYLSLNWTNRKALNVDRNDQWLID